MRKGICNYLGGEWVLEKELFDNQEVKNGEEEKETEH